MSVQLAIALAAIGGLTALGWLLLHVFMHGGHGGPGKAGDPPQGD